VKEDLVDPLVKKRLEAKKRLTVEPANGELDETLGQHAWALSGKDSRETAESGGPIRQITAQRGTSGRP
jgi:hypothetical protein